MAAPCGSFPQQRLAIGRAAIGRRGANCAGFRRIAALPLCLLFGRHAGAKIRLHGGAKLLLAEKKGVGVRAQSVGDTPGRVAGENRYTAPPAADVRGIRVD
jgi:hypothetical protein